MLHFVTCLALNFVPPTLLVPLKWLVYVQKAAMPTLQTGGAHRADPRQDMTC
jgi:hypothetical protein